MTTFFGFLASAAFAFAFAAISLAAFSSSTSSSPNRSSRSSSLAAFLVSTFSFLPPFLAADSYESPAAHGGLMHLSAHLIIPQEAITLEFAAKA